MAIFKQFNAKGRYHDDDARADLINYIFRMDKARSGYIGGIHVDPFSAAESMTMVASHFNKDDRIRLRHFVLSFEPDELCSLDEINEIAQYILSFIGQRFQCVYALHEDRIHPHVHFIFNSVSFIDGHKFHGTRKDYYDFLAFLKDLLLFYDVPILRTVSVKTGVDVQDID